MTSFNLANDLNSLLAADPMVQQLPAALPTLQALSPAVDPLALKSPIRPPTANTRTFDDYAQTRRNIFDRVASSVLSKFPLKNTRYSIELEDLHYGKDSDYTLKEQKEALLKSQTLYYPLRGRLVMKDVATGTTVDKTAKSITLARVPYLTNRGTFINNGNEYAVTNQSRLLPGPYIRKRKSGEYEAHFNTTPGEGRAFRLVFVPETGKFNAEIGQSKAPAYPMFRALGVSDEQLEATWGKELLDENRKSSEYDTLRIYERLTNNSGSGLSEAELYAGIKDALNKTKMDPEVSRRTLANRQKSAEVPLRGTLKIDTEGYLTVPAELVSSVFYALRDSDAVTGVAPWNGSSNLVVITDSEIKDLKKVFRRDFATTCGSGRRFTYKILKVLPPVNGEYCIDVESPELEQLRRSLLLPAKPLGGFRLVVGQKVAADINDIFSAFEAPQAVAPAAPYSADIQIGEDEYDRVTGNVLLRASQKALNAYRGVEEQDDRDSLAYQKFLGPEDFFSDRIEKDAGAMARSALFKATNKGNLQSFRNAVFTPILNGVLLGSGLGSPIEEVNPMEVLDQNLRIIRTGEGGIASGHGIPEDSRSVQPSHFGYIDPVRTPESSGVGIDLRMTMGASKGSDGQIYTKMRNLKTGTIEPVAARVASDSTIAFPGELAKAAKTGDPVRAMVRGKISYVDAAEVEYELPSGSSMFNLNSNLVPGISGIKGGRLMMGAKYFTQALPIRGGGEAPLVQGLDSDSPDGKSFEEQVAKHIGVVSADKDLGPGVITAVTEDHIEVNHGKEKKQYEVYTNFPFNRKCVTGSTKVWIRRATGALINVSAAEYERLPGDHIRSINLDTKLSAWESVTNFVKLANDKQLLKVTTKSGRTVTVTEDHSLVTIGVHGELEPLYPEECVIGVTRLPVATLPEIHTVTDRWDSLNWGRLAGVYLAEGHSPDTQPNAVTLAVKDANRQQELKALLISLKLKPHNRAVTSGQVSFCDSTVAKWLKSEFGHKSINKAPSEKTFIRSLDFKRGLIQGYMSGDGCLHTDSNGAVQLEAKTVSRLMRDRLVDLLSTLGIFCTLPADREFTNSNWNTAYGFRVISKHIAKLPTWFYYKDRQEKLATIAKDSYRASDFDGIPVVKEARKLVYAGIEDNKYPAYKTAIRGYVARGQISSGAFKPWADSDVMWDTVVSIASVEHEESVYDFEVASSQVFAVDAGLVIHNTYLHNEALVKVGDKIAPGQVLAKSNYSDDKGRLAMGKNLKVAYTIWGDTEVGGANFEDGVVISDSAAKKMASEHMYTLGYDRFDDYEANYDKFLSLFPGKYSQDQLKNIDNKTGVIKPGTVVNPEDPIILGVGEKKGDTFGLVKKPRPVFLNRAQVWEHSEPGLVTDVVKTRAGYEVAIKSFKNMTLGDKLVGRYGDKGVIAAVVPDDKMPRDKQGSPFEVIYNPLAVTSRVNPVQAVEAVLGKIAATTGQPYKLPAFLDESYLDYAQRELNKAGLSDTETIVDPLMNKNVDKVLTGTRYFMNLHHQAEKKLSARDVGGYSTEEAPVKGGSEGAKRLGMADLNALLAHGAIDVIKDARLVRGQKNDEYWRAIKLGTPVPPVKVPFVWDKFVAQLKGAGVNVERQGGTINIYAMTGSDVKKMSGGEVKDRRDINFNSGEPYEGGFFDPKIFGVNQLSFGHFPLAAKVVNPVMEDVVRSLIGLTKKNFEDIVAGQDVKGINGMEGLERKLNSYNLDAEAAKAKDAIKTTKGQARSHAIAKLSYLETMQKRKVNPKDFLWADMPVLPPRFRPITDTGNMQMVADMNYLYKELYSLNDNVRDLSKELGRKATGNETLALYQMVKAAVGLADPASAKLKQKNVNGLIRHVLGSNPKFSMFQRKVLSSMVEGVGNAVISPDPSLDMDHVGVPEDMAFQVFRPYIIRTLIAGGANPIEAMKQVKDRTQTARRALLQEMDKRPVMITRAPTLHKYNFMASRPVLTPGSTLRLSPSVVVGFNADFDGDQMRLHVPSTPKAVQEAYEKMLPSRNLVSAATFQSQNFIKNEFLYGLYLASKGKADKNTAKTFRTKEDAIKAFNRGELKITDSVRIMQ